jgi:protein O-GlcNAc transferase
MSASDKTYRDALAALNGGNLPEAERHFRRFLKRVPGHVGALNLMTVVLMGMERFAEAEPFISKAVKLHSQSDVSFYNYGLILRRLKKPALAEEQFSRALSLNSTVSETWNNRGVVFLDQKKYDQAIEDFDRAIQLNRQYYEACCNKGKSLNLLRRHDDAIAAFDQALAINPNLAEAWVGRGNVLSDVRHHDEALGAYAKALTIKPELAEAWLGRGNVLAELKRYDEAIGVYHKALASKPDLAEAWLGCGNAFDRTKDHIAAAGAYQKVLDIDPNFPFAKGKLLHQKKLSCDWSGVENLIAEIESDIDHGKPSADPFGWQGVAESPRSLQLCAEIYNKEKHPGGIPKVISKVRAVHGKIRIGYLSGEFRDQATSHLIVGMLECHDKSRFEVIGFDNGWDDRSAIRRRIAKSLDALIDIAQLSDAAVVDSIVENQIDILVNLNGYFGDGRTSVFAQRPAPIQVNYLGFPGTIGAKYIDYIVSDRQVIPPEHMEFYTEKVVYLPNCYQANDRSKETGTRPLTRSEFGLPQNGFVFCCFNNNYKIVPDMFDSWMRILEKVEGSVLWLVEDNEAAAANLRKEATARGVGVECLVFSKRIALADHLARHQLADLFLDTLPYNAHTTASDALWSGLPLLTQVGNTFPGKVAASLLNAIGLPELITRTREEYENMAVKLATDPNKLVEIRTRLSQNRLTTPLFDTELFTRHIEEAYRQMYERFQSGLQPDHIMIE